MVLTYNNKLFCTWADRHNGILMSLLLLVAETINNEARISKEAEMKTKFNKNQKCITPPDIQPTFLTFLFA